MAEKRCNSFNLMLSDSERSYLDSIVNEYHSLGFRVTASDIFRNALRFAPRPVNGGLPCQM